MMRALILGAAGQDGRLLAETLRGRGVMVIGLGRNAVPEAGIRALDLRDAGALTRLMHVERPDAIFHLAAIHGAAGTPYEAIWGDMLSINVASLHAVLEYLRTGNRNAQLVYASSVKVFGEVLPARIDDATPMAPRSLYAITKQAATEAIDHYRREHGTRASALHLCNHESWLRPPQFFIPKLIAALAAAIEDPSHVATFHTLDFHCDWGSAAEYMDIAVALVERNALDRNYVIARGQATHARALARALFGAFGLDERRHLREAVQGENSQPYEICCDHLRTALGYTPRIDIEDLCFDILARNFSLTRPERP
jgi:GDPmannose 4,6-dehydratase